MCCISKLSGDKANFEHIIQCQLKYSDSWIDKSYEYEAIPVMYSQNQITDDDDGNEWNA